MTNNIVCTNCGISHPASYVVLDGKCLCDKCWHKLFPYCKSCGMRLTPDMNIAYFKNKVGVWIPFCSKCRQNPACSSCGLPIPIGHKKISGDNIFCSECFSSLLQDSPTQISEGWLPVCKFMKDKFNFQVRSPLPILVAKNQLAELSGAANVTHEAGLYKYTYTIQSNIFSLWKAQKKFSRCQIYLLNGLTTEHSEEVLAHEAGHDLLDSIFPMFSEKLYSEGFAQYIAAEYNLFRNRSSRNEAIFSNQDPIYGDGARLVRDIVTKTGFCGLINALKDQHHG